MSNHVLQVSDVSKIYKIYEKPSDRLLEIFTRKPRHTYFTSLKNVSFKLPQGQSLGVIGQNGAGKSTLLKLLAKTLSPTSGEIKIHGSVAALLELGAGFNPEFSGRQNIYLNATLLGMSDALIRKMEPEIIQFAELEDYIDRPIKTYSSGMYVRLGFAIATAADPDVLIIDEALSVGDANFQKNVSNASWISKIEAHRLFFAAITCINSKRSVIKQFGLITVKPKWLAIPIQPSTHISTF